MSDKANENGVFQLPGKGPYIVEKRKVAAYCRVSTNMEIQETSLEIQIDSFEKTIKEHPDWELVDIYADKGLTGTSAKSRVEFMRMIDDTMDGKIDVILVKSISRFARNTVDALSYTRELKEAGVEVFFEKEKIGTFSSTSEMLLTVYAAFAQEESRSLSENYKAGARQRYANKRPQWRTVYGYYKIGKNQRAIMEDEAENVRWIYEMTIEGLSTAEIAAELNLLNIPTPQNAKNGWTATNISGILKNEKYIGDSLMQKTYVEDFLTKKAKKNTGELPQYYIKDTHEAIVDRETWRIANYIVDLRNSRTGSPQYPYYGFLKCPSCGKPMVRLPVSSYGRKIWRCMDADEEALDKIRKKCRKFFMVDSYIEDAVKELIGDLNPKAHADISEMQKLLEKRDRVEYIMLLKLVDWISFPDCFTIQVHWKWGRSSRKKIEYQYASEVPVQKYVPVDDDNLSIAGLIVPKSFLWKYQRANKRIVDAAGKIIIVPPDEENGIPVVKIAKENEDDCK